MAREISAFADESGGAGGTSKYRIVTLVFHEQDADIIDAIARYELDLAAKGLPNIPFHAGPLMYGKDACKGMELAGRRRMFASFSYFQRKLPYRYHAFAYRRSECPDGQRFMARLRRDLVVFLADHLNYFQSFDDVKIYYDWAQRSISDALREALGYEISAQALLYRVAYRKKHVKQVNVKFYLSEAPCSNTSHERRARVLSEEAPARGHGA